MIYHVMVGPGVLTFVREMGEFFGSSRPELFGFIDSLEAVDIASPGLEFLEGSYSGRLSALCGWLSTPAALSYRDHVGVNEAGASVSDQRTSRPTPTCSAAGRRSSSSSVRSSRAAIKARAQRTRRR